MVRFHLAAIQTMSHPLRDFFRLIDVMLLAAPPIYIAVLAVLVIAWRRMWVSVPLIFWALAAFVTLGQLQPLWGHHVVLLSRGAGVSKWMWGLCRVAGFHGARQAAHRTGDHAHIAGAGWLRWSGVRWSGDRGPRNARAYAPSARQLEMAMALQGVSAADEIVLSDDQYVAALANRDYRRNW